MTKNIYVFVIALVIVIIGASAVLLRKKPETDRDRAIRLAVESIFKIKMVHHTKIVKALKAGASETDHAELLEVKRVDVLAAMQEAELALGIVFDKEDVTAVGPVVVLER